MVVHYRISGLSIPKKLILIVFAVIFILYNISFFSSPLNYGDLSGIENNVDAISLFTYGWTDYFNLGVSNIDQIRHKHMFPAHTVQSAIITLFLGPFLQKIIFIFSIFVLPFVSMYYLTRFIASDYPDSVKKTICVVSSLVYTVNPFIFTRVMGGHLTYVIGIGLFPFLLLTYFTLKNRNLTSDFRSSIKYLIFGGLILALIEQFFPHLVVIFFLFVIFDILFSLVTEKRAKFVVRSALIFVSFLAISAVLNISVYLPSIVYPEYNIQSDPKFDILAGVAFNAYASSVPNVIRLLPFLGHPNYDVIFKVEYPFLNYVYPLLALLGIIFLRNKLASYFAILSLIGIFFAKGLNPPFSEFSQWLYLNIPFFSIFRDPSKFLILTSLAYSIIIGIFIGSIIAKFGIKNTKYRKIPKILILSLLVSWLITSNLLPFITNFESNVVSVKTPDSVKELDSWLYNQDDDFRVLYLPENVHMRDYGWYPQTKVPMGFNFPHGLYILSKPLANSLEYTDTYSARLMGFVEHNIMENGSLTAYLLNKVNAKYVIIDGTIDSDSGKYQKAIKYNEFFKTYDKFQQIELKDFRVYQNKLNSDSVFYAASNALFILGDLNAYKTLYNILPERIEAPLIYINQFNNEKVDILQKTNGKLVFYNTNQTDLIASGLKKFEIDLCVYLNKSSSAYVSKWRMLTTHIILYHSLIWKGVDFQSKCPIYTLESASIEVPFELKDKDKFDIYTRVLLSNTSGNLHMYLDGDNVRVINPKTSYYAGFKWFHMGSFNLERGQHKLKFENGGSGKSVIDGLILVPNDIMIEKRKSIEALLSEKDFITIYSLDYLQEIPYSNDILAIGNRTIKMDINGHFEYGDDFESEKYLVDSHSRINFRRFNESGLYNMVLSTNEYKVNTSELVYKMTTTSPINKLTIFMHYMFVFQRDVPSIQISYDGSSWETLTPTLQDSNSISVDIPQGIRDHEEFYIKFSIVDNDPVNDKWLTSIKIFGVVDAPKYYFYLNGTYIPDNPREVLESRISNYFNETQFNLSYAKISPVKYDLVINSSVPLFVVFRESYSPHWKINKNPNGHFIVDYYANGYYIENSGRFEVTYLPDTLYRASLILSMVFYAVTVLLLIKMSWNRETQNS